MKRVILSVSLSLITVIAFSVILLLHYRTGSRSALHVCDCQLDPKVLPPLREFYKAKSGLSELIRLPGVSSEHLRVYDLDGLASEVSVGEVLVSGRKVRLLSDPVKTLMRFWWLGEENETATRRVIVPIRRKCLFLDRLWGNRYVFVDLDDPENVPRDDAGQLKELTDVINSLTKQLRDYVTCVELMKVIDWRREDLIDRSAEITAKAHSPDHPRKFTMRRLPVLPDGQGEIEWGTGHGPFDYLVKLWAEDIEKGCFLSKHFYVPVDAECNLLSHFKDVSPEFIVDLLQVRRDPRMITNPEHRRNLLVSVQFLTIFKPLRKLDEKSSSS